MTAAKWNLGLGLFCSAFALFALLYWIPTDIESGVVELERREYIIGDAMGPFFLSICMLLLSASLILGAIFTLWRAPRDASSEEDSKLLEGDISGGISPGNFLFLVKLLGFIVASMALMEWVGPLMADALRAAGHDIGTYRQLVATVPYKYLGFIAGGFVMVVGLTALIEGRVTRVGVLTAIFTITVLIIVYDVPFDTLLLPPNGDQ